MKNNIALLALFFVTFSLFNGCKKNDDECPICPSAVSIFPTSGSGGDTLTITGINFAESAADNIVKINSVLIAPESIISGTTTEIKVIVPENCGTGPVTVDFDSELTNQGTPPIFQYNTSYVVGTKLTLNSAAFGIGFADNTTNDYMYVVSNNKVLKINTDGVIIDTIATAQSGQTYKDIAVKGANIYAIVSTSPATNDYIYKMPITSNLPLASLPSNSLKGIAIGNDGNVYVSSTTDNTIKRILTASPYTISNYVSSGVVGPYGLAFDSNNNLYVSEATNHRILKISTNASVSVLAGVSGNAGSTNGNGANATFNSPRGIVCDNNNNVYVAEYTSRVIRKIDANANVTTLAGDLTSSPGYIDGVGPDASFTNPYGIAIDANGNIWVTDNMKVRYIYPQ